MSAQGALELDCDEEESSNLTEAALRGEDNVGRCANTRTPITVEQIRDWCGQTDTHVTVRPVLDADQHHFTEA